MAYKLANDAKTVAFDVVLYGPGNIDDAIADMGLGNPFIKGFFGDIHQFLSQNATAPNRYGLGGITDETIVNDSNIKTYDIAKLKDTWSRQAMHYLFVDRNACITGELAASAGIAAVDIAQKRAFRAVMLHSRGGELIHVGGGNAWADKGCCLVQDSAGDGARRAHGL